MVSNIGVGNDSTHAKTQLKTMPKETRDLFFMKTYELDFPLKHPMHVYTDFDYRNKLLKKYNRNTIFKRVNYRFRTILLKLIHGNIADIIRRKLK